MPEMKKLSCDKEIRQSTFILNHNQLLKPDELFHPKHYSCGKLWNGYQCLVRQLAWVIKACSLFKNFKGRSNNQENLSQKL
jgi:hypothetical protein